ncbi:uncharacterized protein SPPG_09254 [Spizellomyces punctatus DAOM BR117]|uniref:TATA element modulatory factor 1 TATA binding domain-containing protein n=1 Tax=Spizellomyces punctatus (strain DAOM BR117) TaxID=645134 RepID=A0A0L0HG02_SPIPD|nr:uncharacterized protein SPPG_09254 [Spizellomyces punctatus DAOM BR117]KNC99718.1 hypothetical protein SPPG_09254 [Spizellomyces punctatus DAOM BR117]|eukprot:XP_016607758.1 hypothetical protein SPPG_09254 [Spizellomyces punctatus DAOM BR117]
MSTQHPYNHAPPVADERQYLPPRTASHPSAAAHHSPFPLSGQAVSPYYPNEMQTPRHQQHAPVLSQQQPVPNIPPQPYPPPGRPAGPRLIYHRPPYSPHAPQYFQQHLPPSQQSSTTPQRAPGVQQRPSSMNSHRHSIMALPPQNQYTSLPSSRHSMLPGSKIQQFPPVAHEAVWRGARQHGGRPEDLSHGSVSYPVSKRDSAASMAAPVPERGAFTAASPNEGPECVPLIEFRVLETRLTELQAKVEEYEKTVQSLERANEMRKEDTKADSERLRMTQEELNTAILEISRLGHVNENLERLLDETVSHQQKIHQSPGSHARSTADIPSTDAAIMPAELSELRSICAEAQQRALVAETEMDRLRVELSAARSAAGEVIALRNKTAHLEAMLAGRLKNEEIAIPAKTNEEQSLEGHDELGSLIGEKGGIEEAQNVELEAKSGENNVSVQKSVVLDPNGMVTVLERRASELNAELNSSKSEVARLLKLKAKYEAHSVEAEKVYSSMVSIVESDRRRLASLESQLREAQSLLNQSSAQEMAKLQSELEKARLDADRWKARALGLDVQPDTVIETRGDLSEHLSSVSLDNKEKENLRKAAQAELELRAALLSKQNEVEALVEVVREKDVDMTGLKRDYKALLEKNMELNLKIADKGPK